MAGATLALIAELGIEMAAVGGCGLGASIAATIAVRAPEHVAALVLADLVPAAAGEGETAWESYPPDPAERIVTLRGPRALGKQLAMTFHDDFLAQGLRNRYAGLDYEQVCWGLLCLRGAPPIEPLLAQIQAPTMVCVARDDPAHEAVEQSASALRAGRVLSFREAQRPAVHTRPDVFADQLSRFLAAVEDGSFTPGKRTV
jgi:pimeloyl-ACP methyl ester carboxylesterase